MDELADRYPALNSGASCLDFANTFEPDTPAGRERDHLGEGYPGLLAWARYAGILEPSADHDVVEQSRPARPVVDAHRLRAAIYDVFAAIATGAPPSAGGLRRIRDEYARAIARANLDLDAEQPTWSWSADSPSAILGPIAVSAIDLLTSDRRNRIKQCVGERCWVLFIDNTKNRSRHWCQMRYCGNVAKSRRQAAQRRGARRAGALSGPD